MPKSIIAIALDAADPDLVTGWIKEGHLPFLSSLVGRGGLLSLQSLVHLSSGCPWTCFTTGTSPAKHGIFYYHRQFKSGTYRVEKKYADHSAMDPFWISPSRNGKKIALIDIPETYPRPDFSGLHLVNWGVESPNWEKSSSPQHYIKKVLKKYGDYPPENHYQMQSYETKEECMELMKLLSEALEKKKSIVLDALTEGPWDFLMANFAESHWVGHSLWHVHDANHPKHRPELRKSLGDPILSIYKKLDRALEEIAASSPRASFFVFSVSGLCPNYSGSHLLPEILEKLGLGAPQKEKEKQFREKLFPAIRWGPYAIQKLEDSLGVKNINFYKRLIPRRIWDTLTRRLTSLGNNWAESRAFAVPNGWSGGIRINLEGREPHGKVKPGREYDLVCQTITNALLETVNPETHETAVHDVIRLRDHYKGDCLEALPDLIVQWKADAPIQSLSSDKIDMVRGNNPDRRSGAHQSKGLLATSDPEIFNALSPDSPTILDLAPTFLRLMGQNPPETLEGKSLL